MATTTNFYRQGQGYFTDDGRRIANTSELQGLASKGGVEVDARTKQPVKQVATQKAASTVQRPGAYGASDWRSFQALKDSATGLIDILNNKNADLTASQNYFGQAYKDTAAFGGPRDVTTQPNAMITSNKNFRELSPADQASIIASRQGASLAGLQTVADERASREKIYGTGLDNLRKMQEDQLAAKKEEAAASERAADNARQERAQLLQYGAGYYDEKGNFVKGQPVDNYNDYLDVMKKYGISQEYSTVVDYIKGRTVHGGYDLKTPLNTPAPSPVNGTIIEVVDNKGNDKTGWGNYVVIRDEQGKTWRLAHLYSAANYGVGDRVDQGTIVGFTGSSGKSTGPHLHVEVKDSNGKLVDFNKKSSTSVLANKLTQSQLIDISSKTGIAVEELKRMGATQLADLKSTLLKPTSEDGDKIWSTDKNITNIRARYSSKVGGLDVLRTIFDAYLEDPVIAEQILQNSKNPVIPKDVIDEIITGFEKSTEIK